MSGFSRTVIAVRLKADTTHEWKLLPEPRKQDPVLVPDTELLEFICNENEKDIVHMRPK